MLLSSIIQKSDMYQQPFCLGRSIYFQSNFRKFYIYIYKEEKQKKKKKEKMSACYFHVSKMVAIGWLCSIASCKMQMRC